GGGVTSFGPRRCPSGTVGVGIGGHADASLDGAALRCTLPRLPLRTRLLLEPIADTFIASASPTISFGTDTELWVWRQSPADTVPGSYVLTKWDLSSIPPGESISWAEMRMTAFDGFAYGGDGNVYAHRIADNAVWDESTTWETAPAALADPLGHWWIWLAGPAIRVGRLNGLGLRDAVRAERARSLPLGLRQHSQGYDTLYYSREYADPGQRPVLEIFHRPVGG
ncbi:MAG: DNRLRE domain-containing protein, partial [Myxococcales bacterium]|nr:DNRLRE domain-containing protein [Myxococcales bacterium]